ncbi:MAG TPA: hypothetical protein VHS34_06900 [Terriglobales bacterium]|jgi:hypothetical protein|nr:hypothetical protein [Terriglobales bacterium]
MVNPAGTSRIPAQPGLCADCVHARRIESDRGSVFYMCQLALTDSRFKKYPRLPVLSCPGYEPSRRPPVVSHEKKAEDSER